MNPEQYEQLRRAIARMRGDEVDSPDYCFSEHPIRLADVLGAIKEFRFTILMSAEGDNIDFFEVDGDDYLFQFEWNLSQPFDRQSDETLIFLFNLLVKNK